MKFSIGERTFTWELGTLGMRIGPKIPEHEYYADVFIHRSPFRLRRFVNDRIMRRWETLTRRGWRIDRIEVLHAENAARVFRRTMKPYVLLTHRRTGRVFEAMSYPCPNFDGSVTIMVRTTPEDPTTLDEFSAEEFEPVSFVATNVPAENPLPPTDLKKHAGAK